MKTLKKNKKKKSRPIHNSTLILNLTYYTIIWTTENYASVCTEECNTKRLTFDFLHMNDNSGRWELEI